MRLIEFNLELFNSSFPRRAAQQLAPGHKDLIVGSIMNTFYFFDDPY